MQTFLPYADFQKSAEVLDDKRLGKQRSESIIILKTLLGEYEKEGGRGWPHHPATKMWRGFELALCEYSEEIATAWRKRGHADTTLDWFRKTKLSIPGNASMPTWIGNEAFHRTHRSNLLRKMPDYYGQFWPGERDDLPYLWPI